MLKEVVMPKLTQSMTEGTVIRWLKKEGEPVKKGEILLEIETDKATVEVESTEEGIIHEILVREGNTVPVFDLLGSIDDSEAPV
jgi:pyruvate/2-oxoglutarate dehydrogenase complex dihydrolipoamide acyltransferase (E2) component